MKKQGIEIQDYLDNFIKRLPVFDEVPPIYNMRYKNWEKIAYSLLSNPDMFIQIVDHAGIYKCTVESNDMIAEMTASRNPKLDDRVTHFPFHVVKIKKHELRAKEREARQQREAAEMRI